MRLNVCKFMGPNDMHPEILKEVADMTALSLSITFEKSWLPGVVPGDWKKENITLMASSRADCALQISWPPRMELQHQWTIERVTDVVYMDFCKVLDKVSHYILISKLQR